MTYATLLVHLDIAHDNAAGISVAGTLAEKLNAGVVGAAACEVGQSAYFAVGERAAELIEESRQAVRHKLVDMEQHFLSAMRSRARSIEFRSALEFPTSFVARQARVADLLITGPRVEGETVDPLRTLDLGELLLEAGRPVLVVPPEVEWLDTRVVMVAWKDTRESRRAIVDGLPLLRLANEVILVEILEDDVERPLAVGRLKDVGRWLAGHGITAQEMVPMGRGDAPEHIERIASEVGAQTIVAGAYGHSRFREWVLGGVTRHLITQRRRCCLLSH
jgi:nucleotide-binding universal stress UspA family protein